MNEIIEILWNVICIFNLIFLFVTVICAQPDTSNYFALFAENTYFLTIIDLVHFAMHYAGSNVG